MRKCNFEKTCKFCGKRGVYPNGLCVECNALVVQRIKAAIVKDKGGKK